MKLRELEDGITLHRSDEEMLTTNPDLMAQLGRLIGIVQKHSCIAQHPPEILKEALLDKRCVLALNAESNLIGFCYLQADHDAPRPYVEPSLIVVDPDYRGKKLSKMIRKEVYKIADDDYSQHDVVAITFLPDSYSYIKKVLGFEEITYQQIWEDCHLDFGNTHFHNAEKIFKRRSKGFRSLEQMQIICQTSNYPFWIFRQKRAFPHKNKIRQNIDKQKSAKLPRKGHKVSA